MRAEADRPRAGLRVPGRGVAAGALLAIVGITIGWWGLALYPVGAEAPSWILRTRAACFGSVASGLPSAGGWVLLVGEPLGMVGTLVAVWGGALRSDLAWLAGSWWGRLGLGAVAAALSAAIVASGARVTGALARVDATAFDARSAEAPIARLDTLAPPLVLLDQRGEHFDLRQVGGPAIVTFAFAHCAEVCPTLVHELREARDAAGRKEVPIVVVTLDPWRDTPARLAHIAAQWKLAPNDRLLGGDVDAVNRVLDAWHVGRVRNGQTGDVAHAAVAYLVTGNGRVQARLDGGMFRMGELLAPR